MGNPSNEVRLEAVKNGERVAMVYTASKIYLQSSKIVHLILSKGDQIWIKNHSTSTTAKLHDWKVYNAFSGILIRDL